MVREAHFEPSGSEVDYIKRPPEIVVDVLAELLTATGVDLLTAYKLATVPCIVEFSSTRVGWDQVVSAIAYVSDNLALLAPQSVAASGGYSGGGVAVPADRIVLVEVLSESA